MNKNCNHLDNLDSQLYEVSLRPPLFDQFCGQENVIERLKLLVEASLQRHEPLQHILLSGPPGLGKTTLAHILGNAMQAELRITSGPTIEKAGDLAGLLTTMPENGILFIDEIHRLQPVIEEYLYPAMEDFRVDILIDQGPNARSVRLKLPQFTLLGATTRTGMLTAPLRSRFGMSCRLEYYSNNELKKIILRSGTLLRMHLDEKGALEIANRSRGTPRIANNLLRWVRDYTQVRTEGHITQSSAIEALNMLKIDPDGCDEMDRKILEMIIEKFGGGPVGINSLAIAVGEEAETLEEIHEPYLIMQGYIKRTHQGRVAMRKAYEKLDKIFPDEWNQQKKLI